MNKNNYFNKIQSDYIFTYLLSFFNLSDIRSIIPLSKKFLKIITKDNKKIIRDTQNKLYSIDNEFISNYSKYKISSFSLNKSPILNSILAENFLISSSYQFDSGFSLYDLTTNKLIQKIIFKEKNYSYIYSMLYIKEKKFILLGTNNGYIISYYLDKKNFLQKNWEYNTGLNKDIKNIEYYKLKERIIIISLDSDNNINLNFLRIFYIDNNNIKYIKTYIIKNYLIYNIKCFDGFICLALNEGLENISDDNNINYIYKKDKIMNNYLSIINLNKIKIYFSNNKKNYEYIINNNTYEDIEFDFILKEHKSYINDYLFLKENNIIISVEYLSPYLFIWDINTKLKIKTILLPHTDSILSLLNISNKMIASTGRDRKIYIYNIEEIINQNIIINKYEIKCNHSSDIYKLNYYLESNNNINKIISSSFDKTIKVFNYKEYNFNKITKTILTGHSSSICCIKLDLIRKQILTVDINCVINIWEYNELHKFYCIIKSIEMNSIIRKKEFIDDIILLYDNYNSIIKIDRSKKIKIYSLTKEEFLYEFEEESGNIIKILDFCNSREFICYTSQGCIILYNYKINKKDNKLIYEIKKIKDININNTNNKMTCFEMLSWKYKLIGIGYHNNIISIIKFDNKFQNYKNISINLDSFNNNNYINQIKCLNLVNNKVREKNSIEFLIYIIFSINNSFFVYSILSDFVNLNVNFINKIGLKYDINCFGILNKNLIISSYSSNFKIELIHLPDYEKGVNKDIKKEEIEISEEYFYKLKYTNNKKGIFCVSNNSIKYIEFS